MAEVLKHHKARKRFGQNFLNDDFWINKIAEAVDPKEGQKIIEIGPGQARRKVRRSSKSGRDRPP